MPGMDGSGPMGQGPMTGGGRGPCSGAQGYAPDRTLGRAFGRGMGYGFGRGFGRGRGYGQGRGFGYGGFAPGVGATPTADLEARLARLEAENRALRAQLQQQD